MTKMIQSLANNVLFGKEAYTVVPNPFLEANGRKVRTFLETVSVSRPSSADLSSLLTLGFRKVKFSASKP